jgi:aspartyl-tRNA(Asn)/glutamyl-tRNA(Gln) amidotransferase subunit B
MNDIQGLLNEKEKTINETKITPKLLVELIETLEKGEITMKIAKKYIPEILQGVSVKTWIKKQGVQKVTDEKLISDHADKAIAENPQVVNELKKNPKSFQFFVGQIMKATKGQADIELTTKILKEKLKDKMDK